LKTLQARRRLRKGVQTIIAVNKFVLSFRKVEEKKDEKSNKKKTTEAEN